MSTQIESVPHDESKASAGHDRVGAVVRPVAVTAPPTATLRDAADQMTLNDVGLVVITRSGVLAGVLSERDIVRALADGADPDEERVADQMALDVVSVDADTPPREAVQMMLEGGIRHLPVIDGSRIVGVVSMRDLVDV